MFCWCSLAPLYYALLLLVGAPFLCSIDVHCALLLFVNVQFLCYFGVCHLLLLFVGTPLLCYVGAHWSPYYALSVLVIAPLLHFISVADTSLLRFIGVHRCPLGALCSCFVGVPLLCFISVHWCIFVVLVGLLCFCWCSLSPICYALLVIIITPLLCFVSVREHPFAMFCWCSWVPPSCCWCFFDVFYCGVIWKSTLVFPLYTFQ